MPLSVTSRRLTLKSFTLVELLVVMAIIAILAALVLGAASAVFQQAARKRAAAEIQAMSTALESYKIDNGVYPPAIGLTTNGYAGNDGSGSLYQAASFTLYTNITGQANFATPPTAGKKSYIALKANQVGNPTGNTYIKDPWNYSYGYSTGDATPPVASFPYNGTGFFDLWSTGNILAPKLAGNPTLTNAWISNWQ